MKVLLRYCLVISGVVPLMMFFISCTNIKVEIVDSPTTIDAGSVKKPVVKVFLENSGSMDGFMCDGSELKDGMYNYLTTVKDICSKMELYYINSETKKQEVSLSQYIRNLNPTDFKKAGGSRAFTDIPDLFARVLKSVGSDTIAIYISDCILDIQNHSAPNFLNITKTDMHSVFGEKIAKMNDLAVCVYQLESFFNGTFYFPKGGLTPYKGRLPYYMILIGSSQQLANLRENVSDKEITHGVRNYLSFSPSFEVPAVLLQGNKPQKSLELNTKKNDRYHFNVGVNLNMSLETNKVLSNPQNYSLTTPSKIQIESILPVTAHNSKFSHIIEFNVADEAFGNVVTLRRLPVPLWVKESNDSQGSSIIPGKTFGIEYILTGISEAFKDKSIATFKLNIKKQ